MPEVARAWHSWSEKAQVHSYLTWDALMDRPGLAVKEGPLDRSTLSYPFCPILEHAIGDSANWKSAGC